MKIITSGTTLAELGRDCHTQAMVCATLAAHAVALSPPSTPRRKSRPLALALACAIAASTLHLQLALASPAPATSSLSRLVRSRPFSRISASSTASAAKALHPSPADSRHLRARPLPQECSAATLSGARGLQKQPRPSARRSARPTRACSDAKYESVHRLPGRPTREAPVRRRVPPHTPNNVDDAQSRRADRPKRRHCRCC